MSDVHTSSDESAPLVGVRVLDLTTVFMGPYATQILAEYGADVIKVESPDGDIVRRIVPARHAGMGAPFLLANRGKRSIVLDLKRPEGRRALLRLAERSDVLIYNVRPAAMARLGLAYDDVRAVNPRIVYVGAFGFGQDGPYADRPAYDDLIQGAVGIASLPQRVNGSAPRYVPAAIVDRTVGLAAVNAVCAALFARERTGHGRAVEVPMFETMAHLILADHLYGHAFEPPLGPPGYPRVLAPDRRPYDTRDGYISVLVYSDAQWSAFFDLIGRPDLKADARFSDAASRTRHAARMYEFVATEMRRRTTAEWLEALTAADIPAMPMHTLETLLEDDHLAAIGFFPREQHPTEGALRGLRAPATWHATAPVSLRPAPRLGEHSREVLAEAGFQQADIERLVAAGVTSEPATGGTVSANGAREGT